MCVCQLMLYLVLEKHGTEIALHCAAGREAVMVMAKARVELACCLEVSFANKSVLHVVPGRTLEPP